MALEKNIIDLMAHKKNNNTLASNQAANVVFIRVLDSVLVYLEKAGSKVGLTANINISGRLWDFTMPAASRTAIKSRLMRGVPLKNLMLDEPVIPEIFQVVYEELCDEVGPVLTDKACRYAISQAETTEAAMIYSPNNLL